MFFCIAVLQLGILQAQAPLFEQFTRDEGLPTNEVYDMLQHSDGYLYLATDNGVARFNGISFSPVPTTTGEMPSGSHLQKDGKGRLFFITFDGRLFQVGRDSLQLVMPFQKESKHFPLYQIDKKDKIWVSTTDNLYCLSGENFEAQRYHYPDSIKRYTGTTVPVILTIQNDSVLLQTAKRTVHFHPSKGFQVLDSEWEGGDLVFSWKGQNYLSNRDMNHKSQVYTLFDNRQVSTDNPFYEKLLGISVISVSKGLGGIWFATYRGLFFYHPQKGWRHFLKGQVISEVLVDDQEQLWVSTVSAGLFCSKTPSLLHFSKTNSPLYSSEVHSLDFQEDKIALGFDKGKIQEWNLANNNSTVLQTGRDLEVQQVAYYHHDILIANSGLFRLDAQRRLYKNLPALSNQKMFAFLNDSTLLYGGASLVGLLQCSQDKVPPVVPDGFRFVKQHRNDNWLQAARWPYINSIEVRNKRPRCLAAVGKHFIVAYNDGCFYYDFKNIKELHKDDENVQVNSIEKTDSFIWLGSSTGIHLFARKSLQYQRSVGPITKILKLRKVRERMYALTPDGLFALDLRQKKLLYWLDRSDGFYFDQLKDIRYRKDSLWIAAKTGLYRLPYDLLPNNEDAPKLFLQYIELQKKRQSLPPQGLQLDYGFERLLLQFDVLALKGGEAAHLHYILEGQSDEAYQANDAHQIVLKDLLEGSYTLRVYSENEDGKRAYFPPISIRIAPPFHRTLWFNLLIVSAVSGVLGLFFWWRLRATRRKLTLERKLIASELRAIQSQMNPHFIFNALNSIQDLILKKDIRQSNKYLARFSNLVRKVLKASEDAQIQLREELHILELYLDLEKLRLGEVFSFAINCDLREEDLDDIYLPAMLLQPFVENAIKHGLLHKKGSKELEIDLHREAGYLHCRIEDNGIGRKRSAEIHRRQSMRSNGFSTRANEKRIHLLNQAQKRDISLEIEDLPQDSGTVVRLRFPI